MKPKIIILEGPDGAGKSTVAAHILEKLTLIKDAKCTYLRDPGGSQFGEAVRESVLLNPDVDLIPMEQMLLFTAVRSATARRINDYVEQGICVVVDRWYWSTRVYQGLAGVSEKLIGELHMKCVPRFKGADLRPFLIDTPFEVCEERLEKAKGRGQDRFESANVKLRRERWNKYQTFAQLQKIDGEEPADKIAERIVRNYL